MAIKATDDTPTHWESRRRAASGIFFSSLAAFSTVESASAAGQQQQQQQQLEESYRIAFNVTNGSLGIKLQVRVEHLDP